MNTRKFRRRINRIGLARRATLSCQQAEFSKLRCVLLNFPESVKIIELGMHAED